jgi:hypothetical protein
MMMMMMFEAALVVVVLTTNPCDRSKRTQGSPQQEVDQQGATAANAFVLLQAHPPVIWLMRVRMRAPGGRLLAETEQQATDVVRPDLEIRPRIYDRSSLHETTI